MKTKREQILEAIKTTIEGVSSPTDLQSRVYRSRKDAVDRAEAPVVILEPIRDDPNDESYYRLVWRLLVRVSLVVRGEIPDQTADPIISSIYEAVMSDPTLGGLAMDIAPGSVNFELLDSDAGGGVIPIDFSISYQTARESMTTT